jgi:DNA-directed RNA polymerase subunit M/transcription elongation factor TFIIS
MLCKICQNLLTVITTHDNMFFTCVKCYVNYQPEINDSLLYVEKKGTDLSIYGVMLKYAGKDPVNPKIRKDCIACDNKILRQVRLGNDMKLINICIKCDKKWRD